MSFASAARALLPSRRGAAGLLAGVFSGMLAASVAQAQVPVRFTLDWRFEGPAGLFLTAIDKGYFKAEGLDVTIETGNGSREAIPRVASGTYDVGFGDINTLIRFRDDNPGVDLKAVMMVFDRPPFAIVGRKSRGVSADARSLEGKKLGAPAADASFAQWPVFKALNKIDDGKMRFENIGFPVREPMLASGEVDAVFGFSSSAYVNLKARGVPPDDIVLMMMADYGVELYGNALMVSPKFLAEKPEAVRGMLRAIARGMKEAAAHPDAAVQTVLQRNDVARAEIELERLRLTLDQNVVTPWVRENGFGDIDPQRWARALDQIAMTTTLKDRARAGNAFDASFLPPPAERRF